MSNVKTKPIAYSFVTLFIVVFGLVSAATETSVTDPWTATQNAYKTVPVLLAFWLIFTSYAWRWRIFHRWLVPFPDMEGTWQGEVQTTWQNPGTNESPGTIPATLTIKQSYSHISCVMRTAEMTSRSYFADFWIDEDKQVRKLGCSYISTPSIEVRERSQTHEGTVELEIIGNPVNKLKGIYWTTRKTTGSLTFTFHCKEILAEYPTDLGQHPMLILNKDKT